MSVQSHHCNLSLVLVINFVLLQHIFMEETMPQLLLEKKVWLVGSAALLSVEIIVQ